jgi:hypothetical protein
MAKQYIFDYATHDRGSDCFPDYRDSLDAARVDGLAFVAEFVPDAVSWSIREVDEDSTVESVVARGMVGQAVGVWRLGDHPRRRDHSAVLRPDGEVANTFGAGDSVDAIRAILLQGGFVLHEDNTITRADGEAMP